MAAMREDACSRQRPKDAMPVGAAAEIRADIEAHLEVLRTEVRQLEAALAALDGGAPAGGRRATAQRSKSSSQTTGKRGSARTKRTSTGRAPRGQNQERILAALAQNPGAKPKAISEVTGIPRTTVATTMTKLRKAGELPAGQG
jgi:hypothetical protein